jgi:hypothetical protein
VARGSRRLAGSKARVAVELQQRHRVLVHAAVRCNVKVVVAHRRGAGLRGLAHGSLTLVITFHYRLSQNTPAKMRWDPRSETLPGLPAAAAARGEGAPGMGTGGANESPRPQRDNTARGGGLITTTTFNRLFEVLSKEGDRGPAEDTAPTLMSFASDARRATSGAAQQHTEEAHCAARWPRRTSCLCGCPQSPGSIGCHFTRRP